MPNSYFTVENVNHGTETFSGDGLTKTFNIPHELSAKPDAYWVTPLSSDTVTGLWHVSADETNITITYLTAPVSGTDNIEFNWVAFNQPS